MLTNEITQGTSKSEFGVYEPAKRGDYAIFLNKAFSLLKMIVLSRPSCIRMIRMLIWINERKEERRLKKKVQKIQMRY